MRQKWKGNYVCTCTSKAEIFYRIGTCEKCGKRTVATRFHSCLSEETYWLCEDCCLEVEQEERDAAEFYWEGDYLCNCTDEEKTEIWDADF